MRILERLERTPRSPREEVEFLEKRLAFIPRLFKLRREAEERFRADPSNPVNRRRYEETRRVVQEYVDRLWGQGYALSREERELALTRCELSRARWRFIASQRHG